VFPNYDARFAFPGKIGQARLFQTVAAPHPRSEIFESVEAFDRHYRMSGFSRFPVVFKFDWGGEGETVFLARSRTDLSALLARAIACERTGQMGFLLQEYIPCGGRSLRVAVVGRRMISYWRVHPEAAFHTGLSHGAHVDAVSDPNLRRLGENEVALFCGRTGIDLAGIDVLFGSGSSDRPVLLEINYFFGRIGLGGSEAFYRALRREVRSWIRSLTGERTAAEPAPAGHRRSG
jgi:ribosomal protein S6--L-glutamate ligase